MKTENEIRRELETITDRLKDKPKSEFYQAYKLCLEWILN